MGITKQKAIELYSVMVKIRMFEEQVQDLYARGMIPGLAHLYIGEEAVAAGVCGALEREDYITSTHRGHGHVIAKGADVRYMMAELFGKTTGYCKGKGGSMHIADMAMGILGANGIAGGGLPIAVGAAFSAKYRNSGQIVACFFGDGSSNNGTFHESLNFASLHKLPVIFVCENNLYGISVSQRMHQPIQDIAIRATSYDMPGVVVDGNDAVAVYEASLKAVKRARAGEGPTLIECKTYRWRGHHEGDPNLGARYRDREEIEQWKKRCPIKRLEGRLLEERWLSRRKMEEIQKAIAQELDEAVSFAQQSPYPAPGDIFTDVYVAG